MHTRISLHKIQKKMIHFAIPKISLEIVESDARELMESQAVGLLMKKSENIEFGMM